MIEMLRVIIQTVIFSIFTCESLLSICIASPQNNGRQIELNVGKSGALYLTKLYNKRFEFADRELKLLDGGERSQAAWFGDNHLERETFSAWLLDVTADTDSIKTSEEFDELEGVTLKNLYERYVSNKFLGKLTSVTVKSRVAFRIPSLSTAPYNDELDSVLGFQYQITGSEFDGKINTVFFYLQHGETVWQLAESNLDNLFSDEQENCFFREIMEMEVSLTACATVENSGGN